MDQIKLNLVGIRNQKVPAILRSLDMVKDVLSWYVDWFPHMYDLAGTKLHGDSHWDVPRKWEHFINRNNFDIFILEAEERIQGYIILESNFKGFNGKPSIYIPFLAVAPWNRRSRKNQERNFKNIGKLLLSTAAMFGIYYNDSPVFELHSLPGAENFYRKERMKETGKSKNNLKEFYMEKTEAFDLLRFLMTFLEGEE